MIGKPKDDGPRTIVAKFHSFFMILKNLSPAPLHTPPSPPSPQKKAGCRGPDFSNNSLQQVLEILLFYICYFCFIRKIVCNLKRNQACFKEPQLCRNDNRCLSCGIYLSLLVLKNYGSCTIYIHSIYTFQCEH